MTAVMSFALVGVTFWEGARIAAVAIAFYYLAVTVLQPQPLVAILYQSAWMLTTTVFAALGFYLLDRTQRIAWLRQLDLIGAQEQIRSLLHNVLPPAIAERKLAGESPIADTYAQASLLFADVVGFTPLSFSQGGGDDAQRTYERLTPSSPATGWRSRRSATATWWPAACRVRTDHLTRLTNAAMEMQAEAAKVRTPDGQSLASGSACTRTCHRRRDRPGEIRSTSGRYGEHGEPHGSVGAANSITVSTPCAKRWAAPMPSAAPT